MEIKLNVWLKLVGKENKTYKKLHHEKFSENEILEIFYEYLKDKYHEPFEVEIDEITSR